MKIKKFVDILTASLTSLKKEGKFARQMLWKHARSKIIQNVYGEIRSIIQKFVKIVLVGLFLSIFQEATVIDWVKAHWVTALAVYVTYVLISRLISVIMSIYTDKSRSAVELELKRIIWQKCESVGLGTRVGNEFRQKMRTAKRCSFYDIEHVGLWPIDAISSVISSVVLLTTLAFLNWRICIIFVITGTITAFVGAYMMRWLREREKDLQEKEELSDEYYRASLSVGSVFLGTARKLFDKYMLQRSDLVDKKRDFHRKVLLVTTSVGTLTTVAVAIQLYLSRESLFENASLFKMGVTISTIVMAVGAFASAIKSLFGDHNSIEDVRGLQEFLDLPDEEKDKKDNSFEMSDRDRVHIIETSFAYPYIKSAPTVIREVSIDFVPGEAVALVGANGSGKTTLGSLLSNIYRPKKGCIMYGGVNISEYTARSVLEHTVVVPQTGSLYELPISESLFGVMDMSGIDMERYSKAIAMSGAKEVLDRLPNGIHTQIGTAYAGGTDLSGGETQRLRLAGYFYKMLDPRTLFVVADEPSRYLDPKTRSGVYTELISLAHDYNKIVLVISHDAELERFDRVVVLEKGRVFGDYRGNNIAKAVHIVSKRLAGDLIEKVNA